MFGFVQFDKFKAEIIEYKNTMQKSNQETGSSTADSDGENFFSKQGADTFWKLFAEDLSDPKYGWKKQIEIAESETSKLTCIVHQKPMEDNSSINMLRSDIFWPGISKAAFKGFIKKYIDGEAGELMQNAKEFETLEKYSEDHAIFYVKNKMPLMTARDFVMHFQV